MMDIQQKINSLSPQKRALLVLRNTLSSSQQRLWFTEQLGAGGQVYNLHSALRLEGRVEMNALQRSLDEIVRRHEALRTTFFTVDGQPIQIVHNSLETPLRVIDLNHTDEAGRQAEIARLLTDEASREFDLVRGPLLRFTLLRLREDAHIFQLTMHHIISDGWSLRLFFQEMAALYEGFVLGRPPRLGEPAAQYGALVQWEQQWLQSEAMREQLAYWTEQLKGMPSVLELPTDRPRLKSQSFRGASQSFTISSTETLKGLSQRSGTTLFTTLLAVFKVLLYRLTGQEDMVVGSPVANRNLREFEEVIGLFINILVMRTRLSGDPSFVELLRRVRQTVQGAQAHQELPFDRLVEELQPERDLSHAPLVQVLFVQLVKPPQAIKLPGLVLKPQDVDAGTMRFDLTLSIMETEDGLLGRLEYNSNLFEPATADRLVQQFRMLVGGVVSNPDQRISELPLLTPHERHQLLVEWQDTRAELDENLLFTNLFERQVESGGDRVALLFEEHQLTYRELNQKANQLARHLRQSGVGPGALVALYLDRSAQMLVSLLAVLKAGAAYVPLDPGYPRERLKFILEDSRVAVMVTQERLAEEFAGDFEVLSLERDGKRISSQSEENLAFSYSQNFPAYVIYTSGSTGKPKGVPISHRALINFLQSMRREPGLTEQDSLLAITTLSFDIAALELLLPLIVGARVVIASRVEASDGAKLARVLATRGITIMQATPATWQLLIDSGWQGEPSLKMLCGGDALTADLAAQLLSRGASLWNLYGPTETAIWSAAEEIVSAQSPIPIGRPIANTEIHILDRSMSLLPVGVPGEVCIGGSGLSSGYAGRPGLTAEKFVPHPFSGRPGERLYRTGDLARRLPGGQIEFLGRIDYQVKLRGFRIELGEIESVLTQHPAVREAVVVVQENAPGDKRLVAFVVPEQDAAPSAAVLREFLGQKLPPYMVPPNYVVLAALPRTANGKLDRRAMSSLEFNSSAATENFVAPRTPIEEEVGRIWAEVLKTDEVGIFNNFFELGGNSLLAMQLIHRVGLAFQVEIPLHVFFGASSVAEMAAEIARRRAELTTNYLSPTQVSTITPDPAHLHEPFPLNDVQQAYWIGRQDFYELGNVSSHSYTEIDFTELDTARLNHAINLLIARHEMLRAVVLPDGSQQILESVPPYRMEVTDLRGAGAAEADAHLRAVREEMSHQVLATDRWPLFDIRASLFSGGVRIHFGLDYLIADAWSVGIIFREIFEFYDNPGLELPRLEITFRDWVLAEIAQQGSESHRKAEQYWRERLPSLPPAPELPLATSPDALRSPRFVRRAHRLSPEVWARVQKLGARAGLTPSGILLGAFSEILTVWSKIPRFTINVTLFNRPPHHPQINEIVGDFTSLILLAIDGTRAAPLGLRARAVQEQLWKDLEHRSFSGVQVLRELTRMQGRPDASIAPVVFTSTLGQNNMHTGAFAAGTEQRGQNQPGYSITQTPQVWLDHQVGERDGALVYNWDAVEDLFYPGVLDDMWDAYNHLLESLAAEETWQETERPWLPEAHLERRREVNATQSPIPAGLLHSPFEAQAKLRPDDPAVISPTRTLSYRQLDRLSTHLAHRLRRLDVRPNQLVGVVMEKGWEQVVAVLAILKSGAAYLPINSLLPAERIRHLLREGEVSCALTQPHVERSLEWPEGVSRISVEWSEPANEGALAPAQTATDLAYVIFTSGSTGQPKGVMIDHRGALNTVVDVNTRFGVGAHDRVLALSSLSFDLSVYDIFGILGAGAAIVLPEADATRDPAHWIELVRRERVTIWNSVPALMEMFEQYASAQGTATFDNLRVVMMSGDWIPLSLPERLRRMCPHAQLISMGGATEASIWSIIYDIQEVDAGWVSIPYGKPMVNQRFYVLNEMFEECPEWVVGQLYIGGIGLAQGYWKDEAKTSGSFITHPVSGERLYRTGDLGRYWPDGNIEFLGREDSQVKIQGHRIELGEIEAALEQHEAVQTGVALAVGAERTNRRLVAYVILRDELSDVESALRSFLQGKLPEYMVPTSISAIESLPLSSNGKVDRQALAQLQIAPSTATSKRTAVGPRTPLEERIANIWAEVLKVGQIGVDDNFFSLGGDSLTAIRVVTRVREAFGIDVPLRQLFEAQTVSELAILAQQLTQKRVQEQAATLASFAIEPDAKNRFEPFPLNDIQYAYWIGRNQFFDLGNIAAHGYAEFELYRLDIERLNFALQKLIERHDMLRAIVLPDGRQQILRTVPPYRVRVFDLRGKGQGEATRELEAIRSRMSHQMLSTSEWPLFEISASVQDERVRLHVSVDILVVDAWSSRILSRELVGFYNNPEASLEPLEVSFRDYVLSEIAFQDSELYRVSQKYWLERLQTIAPAPELPMVKTLGEIKSPHFVRHEATLDAARWQRLKTRAGQAHLTPSVLLLAAFAHVLRSWSRSPRFTINLTVFNRMPLHRQVGDIVGDFTSVILMSVDASRAGTFELHARSLQEQLWEAMEHRNFSGVAVLRELAKMQKKAPSAITPVVFTSNLFEEETDDSASVEDTLQGEQIYGISQTPQVWLDYQAREQNGSLLFNWDVIEELFPEGLFNDMFDAYCRLLESLSVSEDAWHEEGNCWLPPHQLERRREVNATQSPIPAGLLHSPFEAQVRQHPDAPAVISPTRTLSYRQLDRLSTHLARRLRELGAKPNQLVGVVMEKGWEQVVAVLAILKSGAAYLPIDPALPTERIHYLLREGEASWALTQPHVERSLEWPEGVGTLSVEWGEPPEGVALAPTQEATDLAYVIFTSGSTGQPKGVMIDHRGALNTVVDVNTRFGVGAHDRVLALSSLSFDLSVYDIFGILGAGGAIVLPEAAATRDPQHWLELVRREKVTIWNSVPALMEMFEQYVTAQGAATFADLKVVMMSGDWIPLSLPERLRRMCPRAQLISMGGATEASIWSIIYEIEEVRESWTSIPYGKPMVNQSFHVLNEMLEECPEWVAGQLYIGGIGLAQGYWKDEAKTSGSFIVHPTTGERLYRTGDTGRYWPDGNIEFLGREDLQVKIQGHRIELGEIEAALEQHEAVQAAVVLAVGKERTNRRLVAYVVPKDGAEAAPVADAGVYTASAPHIDSAIELRSAHEGSNGNRAALAHVTAQGGNGNGHGGLQTYDGKLCVELPLAKLQTTRDLPPANDQGFSPEVVGLDNIKALLSCLLQVKLDELPLPKYRYPSAGNLYPVQAYVFIKPARVEGIGGGIYYYHPQHHSLMLVGSETAITPDSFLPTYQAGFGDLDFALFLIARMDAIVPMYDQLSPDFCLLEAGYMGQLLTTTAQDNGVELRPLRFVDFDKLRNHFAVDDRHILVHAFAGSGKVDGKADAARTFATETEQPELAQSVPDVEESAAVPSAWSRMSVVAHSQANVAAGRSSAPSGTQLTDKIDRLEFKFKAAGLRQIESERTVIPLGKPNIDQSFKEDFTYRRSDRDFLTRKVPFSGVNALLGQISQFHTERLGLLRSHGHFPDADYPVQTYVYVKADRVEGVPGGTYYYDPKRYRLELLNADVELTNALHADVNRSIFDRSAFSLFMIADPSAVEANPDGRARDLCLLEAGYTGQHLMTAAPADGIGLCPIGWLDFELVRHHLNLDSNAILLHSFLGGRIEPRYSPQSGAARRKQDTLATAGVAAQASDPNASARARSPQESRQADYLAEELRSFVRQKLPEYMVPPTIILMDEIPLSANGKVDRKTLAALHVEQHDSTPDYVAPRDAVERQLTQIWGDLLDLKQVSIIDNFFAIGGDSVKGIQFLARAKEAGFDINVRNFFEQPFIARLAEIARAAEPAALETAAADRDEAAATSGSALSDFPDAEMSQEELEDLIAQFEATDDANPNQ